MLSAALLPLRTQARKFCTSIDVRAPRADPLPAAYRATSSSTVPSQLLSMVLVSWLDKHIHDKTPADWAKVCDTKITGLDNFLAALNQEALKAMLCFSSSTARFAVPVKWTTPAPMKCSTRPCSIITLPCHTVAASPSIGDHGMAVWSMTVSSSFLHQRASALSSAGRCRLRGC